MQIFKLCIFALLLLPLARLCHFATDGFRLSKIENNTFDSELSYSCEEELQALALLNQSFTYLARGKQSFVFASEDGKYVLKLLNNHYQWNICLLNLLPPLSWRNAQLAYNLKKKQLTLQSYELAQHELHDETGVIYLHLKNTDHLKQTATIRDKLGIAHTIDLDKTAFILQKRAIPAYAQLEEWIKHSETAKAKEAIVSLLALLHTRIQKQIADKDPLIRTNVGFLNGKALFLDLGPFSKNLVQDPDSEIYKITRSLKHWLESHDPSLALFLEQQLPKRIYSPEK